MKKGFTLIELLVVAAIIAVLAVMLIPALSRARATAYAARCKGNLQQLAIAFNFYARDNSDFLPRARGGATRDAQPLSWYEALTPYLYIPSGFSPPRKPSCEKVKQCPGVQISNPDWRSYKMNALLETENRPYYHLGFHGMESEDVDTILLFDGKISGQAALESGGDWTSIDIRHRRGANVLFLDGHVLWEPVQSLTATQKEQTIFWDPKE